MGYYIETESNTNKTEEIIRKHGATEITQVQAKDILATNDPKLAIIVVVDNGAFEAAAFAYNECEFQDFTLPNDYRDKRFLVMNRDKAKQLTKYKI